jgi:hypothetical protein
MKTLSEVECVELGRGGKGGGVVVFLLHVGIGAFNKKEKGNYKKKSAMERKIKTDYC